MGTVVLSALNTHWARMLQLKKSEDYALVLVENLNHQIFTQFLIPVLIRYGKIQLREEEQFKRMDKVVRSTLHSFKVDQVNIYDMGNTVSYSFNKSIIGQKDIGGTGYQNAIEGQSTSRLIQRGNFWEILLGIPKESKIVTFAPLRVERPMSTLSGPVLGVVEIVQDLSEEYQAIFKFQIIVILTYAIVMGVLFLVLLFVVKRGESISEQRAQERLELKEQLSRAERLSSLGEMTAGISHEIRNPLGIIRSSAELLRKKMTVLDPANTIPNVIVEETNRLNDIITGFISFAKPKKPNLIPCRIEDVIEKNIKFLESQMQEQGYQVLRHYENSSPEIMADFAMMYQAFLNILINAMQAMPQGGNIHIGVGVNEQFVNINFEDEGEGIKESVLGKIWEPFFTTKDTGSGLGLGIVKNIVESHGGNIHIEQRTPKGTRVVVNLPLTREG
ncbi:MAG: ATP-binding protein [Desulfobacterales bacterium]|nr:ATP-binding protein [Desulfobacterales bacterium]